MIKEIYDRAEFNLRAVLEKLGVSQRQLAKRLGRTQDWIGRVHNAKHLPSWETACRIADCLGVPVSVFRASESAHQRFMAGQGFAGGNVVDALGRDPTTDSPAPRPRPKPRPKRVSA